VKQEYQKLYTAGQFVYWSF